MIFETWAHSDRLTDAELSLGGRYTVCRRDRLGGRGGGVCILVHRSLQCLNIQHGSNAEICSIDVIFEESKCRFIMCYYSPSGSSSELVERMEVLTAEMKTLCDIDYDFIIAGDFNLPVIDWWTK